MDHPGQRIGVGRDDHVVMFGTFALDLEPAVGDPGLEPVLPEPRLVDRIDPFGIGVIGMFAGSYRRSRKASGGSTGPRAFSRPRPSYSP